MNDDKELIEKKVFEALGEASMCWEPRPGGVFDASAAKRVGERLIESLKAQLKTEPEMVVECLNCSEVFKPNHPAVIAELENRPDGGTQ